MTHVTELRERTLHAVLSRNAELTPDRVFLSDQSGTLTWRETLDLSRQVARAFAEFGIVRGDPVLVILDNCREFIATWFGLAIAGAIEVPINPQLVGAQLVQRLNACKASVAVIQAEYVASVDSSAAKLRHLKRLIVVGAATSTRYETIPFAELIANARDDQCLEPISVADPVAIMYTSGSTGSPKGVVLPHGQHYVNGRQAADAARITSEDRIFVCLPLHHNMAQGYGVWPALVTGASVALAARFSRATFWNDVERSKSTVFPFVGAMLSLLAQRGDSVPDNPLRVAYGVPVPAHLHERFEERYQLRLIHCYGSTEATIVAWDTERVIGSVGRILDTFELRIVDGDDLPVPAGDVGEICVRPKEPYSCFSGYYRDPERTVDAFRNAWLHTGDLGRVDENSTLWFAGRKGEVIRHMGESINPYEVEEVMAQYPAIETVAVYGVVSELGEEDVMAAVVARSGADIQPAALREWLSGRIAKFAIPRYIRVVHQLPMTATGKVEKSSLRAVGVSDATYDARAGL